MTLAILILAMDTYNQKLSHLYELIRLSDANSSRKDVESAFIQKVAEYLKVDLRDLANYSTRNHKIDLPDAEHKIIPLFHRLVLLIALEDDITHDQKSVCFDLGVKMGLHPQAVMEIIGIAEEEGVWDLHPNRVVEIFNRFSN